MFKEYVCSLVSKFPIHGTFKILNGRELSNKIRENRVPDKPGVYLIYSESIDPESLLYIGKAGTMKTDGSFKNQGLSGRLCAKQDGKPRPQFFQEVMDQFAIQALYFQWFVTFAEDTKILPAKAEADLIQAYYDTFGRLPLLNKDI